MDKILLAHWVGEFGYELFGFQSIMRSLSKQFDKTIIVSRPLNEALYKDFAEFIPHIPSTNITNFATCRDDKPFNYSKIKHTHLIPAQTNLVHWHPRKGFFHWNDKYLLGARHEFIKFGHPAEELRYDIIFHCRATSKNGSGGKNWSPTNYLKIAEKFKHLRMASIGTQNESSCIDHTEDLRGIGLQKLMDIMSSSQMFVGGSSGPAHLASLCGLPHITWGISIIEKRYLESWNPFQTPVIFRPYWHPEVDEIEKLIKIFMGIKRVEPPKSK